MQHDAAPLLVFDGDCSFCSSSARWLSARWDGPQLAVPWQHLGAERLDDLGLTLADVRSAVWWVEPGRSPARGHLAIAHALRATHGWPSAVGALLLMPPFRWFGAGVYPLIARWRHRLPGGTPACRL